MTVIAQDDHLTAEAWAASDATSAAHRSFSETYVNYMRYAESERKR